MKMMKLFFFMTLLTGVIYPFSITLIGSIVFPEESSGSLVVKNGMIIGSELLSQKFTQDKYFHPRPSASDYKMIGSSATQKSPSNLSKSERSASGSGLDPHISPEDARMQIQRVAAARSLTVEYLNNVLVQHTEGPTFGIWGQPRLNVLKLNMTLDRQGDHGQSR